MATGHRPRRGKRSVQLQQPSEGERGGEAAQPNGEQRRERGAAAAGELEEWSEFTRSSAGRRRDGREHPRAGL